MVKINNLKSKDGSEKEFAEDAKDREKRAVIVHV
jgi:hypothetical protein